MLNQKLRVKQETRVTKMPKKASLKVTEPACRSSQKDVKGTTLASNLSAGQPRRVKLSVPDQSLQQQNQNVVPVLSKAGKPLMPTKPSRAKRWIKNGKANQRWLKGIWYVQLTEEPKEYQIQLTVIGIDPGLKREGFTVKSEAHTYFNLQAEAVDWVKSAMDTRRIMRRNRRQRKTPYRKARWNRASMRKEGCVPPSIKARWDIRVRITKWLFRLFPISHIIVEDIKAKTKKGAKRWNKSFSPLEVGKKWFYEQLEKIAPITLKAGWETSNLRLTSGLKKLSNKLSESFNTHCVDSWVLANDYVGGHIIPDYTKVVCLTPLRFYRRQLHKLQPGKDGRRHLYGSTRSMGFKRGSLVKHPKYGVCTVGGTSEERISLHNLKTGKRMTQKAKPSDCQLLTTLSWRLVSNSSQG